MKRLDDSELEYNGDDGLYYHEEAPFTGVAFTVDRNEEVASEWAASHGGAVRVGYLPPEKAME